MKKYLFLLLIIYSSLVTALPQDNSELSINFEYEKPTIIEGGNYSINTNYSENSGMLEGRNTGTLYTYFKSLLDSVYSPILDLSDYWNKSESAYTTESVTAEGGFSSISDELVFDSGFDDANKWLDDDLYNQWTVASSKATHINQPSSIYEKLSAPPVSFVIGGKYVVNINITTNSGGGASLTLCGQTISYPSGTTGMRTNSVTCSATTAFSINAVGGDLVVESISIKKLGDNTFGGTTFEGDVLFNAGVNMNTLDLNALSVSGVLGTTSKTYLINVTGGYAGLGIDADDIFIQSPKGGGFFGATGKSGNGGNWTRYASAGGDGGVTKGGNIYDIFANAGVNSQTIGLGSSSGNYYAIGGNGTNPLYFGSGGNGTSFYWFAGNAGNSTSGPSNYNGVDGGSYHFIMGKNGTKGTGGTDGTMGSMWIGERGGNVMIGNTTKPSYPLTVYGSTSGITAWFSNNISATGYNTRTEVYDKGRGDALTNIKNADDYMKKDEQGKITNEINHTAFYGGRCYEMIDYDNPIITLKWCDVKEWERTGTWKCQDKKVDGWKIFEQITYKNKTECDMPLVTTVMTHEQGIYELSKENKLLKSELCKKDNSYLWCIK